MTIMSMMTLMTLMTLKTLMTLMTLPTIMTNLLVMCFRGRPKASYRMLDLFLPSRCCARQLLQGGVGEEGEDCVCPFIVSHCGQWGGIDHGVGLYHLS